ncbi:Metallo-dependent phosphatase, partial [Ascoidea rubescens DSM 1968]
MKLRLKLHLIILIVIWFFTFYYHERYLPYKAARSCDWSNWNHHDVGHKYPSENNDNNNNNNNNHNINDDNNDLEYYKIMLIADPQLIDNHTYPNYNNFLLTLSKITSDNYLKKNFKSLSNYLKPQALIFLGDYLDNGRSSSSEYYSNEFNRFQNIFKNYNNLNSNKIIMIPGNHDIGFGNGVKLDSVQRYEENFGTLIPKQLFNFLIIPLDSLSLSNSENPKIYSKPQKFLDNLSNQEKLLPRILLSHVPLIRNQDDYCGKYRESNIFPFTKGYQYQTVLDSDISNDILDKIKPDLIFSGDDHDYCEVYHDIHNNKKKVKEITVKSISMTMGIKYPAVQLLTVYKNKNNNDENYLKYETEICYLPTPYIDIITYVILSIISGLTII